MFQDKSRLRILVGRWEELFRYIVLLSALCFFATQFSLRTGVIKDPDIWWHLRVGEWICEHGAAPATDPFSLAGQGKPWIAYSWLFELLMYGLHQAFGLVGIVIYTAMLTMGITVALLAHVRQFEPVNRNAVLYTAVGLFSLGPLLTPRPWLFTILFFIIELALLTAVRKRKNERLLYWLPPLFALWANLHIQFIYGLFLLCFDAAEPLIERLLRRDFSFASFKANFNLRRWGLIAICFGATLVTPYHWRLYIPIWEYTEQTGVYKLVSELTSPDFNFLPTWIALGVMVWAAFELGWRRAPNRAIVALLLVGAAVSFRSRRDLWFITLITITVILALRESRADALRTTPTRVARLATLVVTCLALFLTAHARKITEGSLQEAVAETYPVAAAKVIEERGYEGPLYNHFNWGGYLIWRLPRLPVSMDGRTNIYGDERISRSAKTWNGGRGWKEDPELAAARLVLADVNKPLCELLRLDRRFELVYEDSVAAVFVASSKPLPGE